MQNEDIRTAGVVYLYIKKEKCSVFLQTTVIMCTSLKVINTHTCFGFLKSVQEKVSVTFKFCG